MSELKFTVPGTPQPKGRARACIRGGKIAHYTPKKTEQYENSVRLAAALAMSQQGVKQFTGAVNVSVCAFVAIPESWSKKKKAAALSGEIMPTSKPDIDNVTKAILDGMNKVVFKDDAQVVRTLSEKAYANEAKVIICVSEA